MKKKYSFIFLIILLIVIGIFFYVKDINLLSDERNKQETQLDRQEIIRDVVQKISDISPADSVLGGTWHVTRFWFIKDSNEDFYVEYEDGHIMRQVLLSAEKKENKINYKILGYFEPGEVSWILKEGEDLFLDKSRDLYEHDAETERWIKKN